MNTAVSTISIKERVAFTLFLCILAAFTAWLRLKFAVQYEPATLGKMMTGTAYTPFQFRALMPFLLKTFYSFAPIGVRPLVMWYESILFAGIVLGTYHFGRAVGLSYRKAALAGACYALVVPFLFLVQPLSRFYYPYDSASALFWTLALIAVATRRHWVFLLIFAIGLLNRESLVLVFLLALAYNWKRMAIRDYVLFAGAGIVLFLAAKAFLFNLYGNNPGAGFASLDQDIMQKGLPRSFETSRLYANLMLFRSAESVLLIASTLGFLWIPVLLFRNRIESELLRKSTYLIPISFLIMMVVANIDEGRVFCELAPIVLVACATLLPFGNTASVYSAARLEKS